MPDGRTIERRRHRRHPLATSVTFHHGPSHRQFPARCVDVSAGGVKLHVPAATPVRPGQPIRLRVDGVYRPEFASLANQELPATIVRVDRIAMVRTGHLAVGVRFDEA
ncbi:MAG: PilZ domain-containing protein [Phycisphaerae bacterium]|nr:PilZ domain-containing protein [Phycisphaerae bacterium]